MLVRARKLRAAIEIFLTKEDVKWLRLDNTEWKQVEYLIDLTKPFCVFTTQIGRSRQPTVHQIFNVYNQLFTYLKEARNKLRWKKVPWMVSLRTGLRNAETKFSEYYRKTKFALGHLYAHAILLTPNKKDLIFRESDDWKDDNYTDKYWDSLRSRYMEVYDGLELPIRNSTVDRTIAKLNNFLQLLNFPPDKARISTQNKVTHYRDTGLIYSSLYSSPYTANTFLKAIINTIIWRNRS